MWDPDNRFHQNVLGLCQFRIAVKLGLAKLTDGANWAQVWAVACLTGVGFTMSLFIGTLAFDDPAQLNGVRLGVLMGSILSGVMGYVLLRLSCPPREINSAVTEEAVTP